MLKRVLSYCIIFISLPLAAFYGTAGLHVLVGRSGLNGNMHIYYRLSPFVYVAYHFLVAFTALGFLFFQAWELATGKKSLHLSFIIFLVLLIVCELGLQARFVGKG